LKTIFITGGTGYIGTRLIKKLIEHGHEVIALVRSGSENKVPVGARVVTGNPFYASSFHNFIPENSVYVQLLGVSHPSPKKKELFRKVDLVSVKASANAAANAKVSHFVYVSVSMSPSKIMKDYQEVRKEGEAYCLSKNLNCTFIRPWYVLGPGHWWPVLLLPFYGIAELVPLWKQAARAKGLVTIGQMIQTLIDVIKSNPQKLLYIEISQIKRKHLQNQEA
jgi:uncharacterized protein YbjT (DUF2867 family)